MCNARGHHTRSPNKVLLTWDLGLGLWFLTLEMGGEPFWILPSLLDMGGWALAKLRPSHDLDCFECGKHSISTCQLGGCQNYGPFLVYPKY